MGSGELPSRGLQAPVSLAPNASVPAASPNRPNSFPKFVFPDTALLKARHLVPKSVISIGSCQWFDGSLVRFSPGRLALPDLLVWAKHLAHSPHGCRSYLSACPRVYWSVRAMQPVCKRGRSMPRCASTCRDFAVMIGILCASVSTGCLRSTVLRQDDGPTTRPALTPAPPANNRRSLPSGTDTPGVEGTGNAAVTPPVSPMSSPPPTASAPPPTELQAAPTPVPDQTALTPRPAPPSPLVTTPDTEPHTDKPTPLLDAALERIAEVTRQQRDVLGSGPTAPSESDIHVSTVVTPGPTTTAPKAPESSTPAPARQADLEENPGPTGVTGPTKPADSTKPLAASAGSNDDAKSSATETTAPSVVPDPAKPSDFTKQPAAAAVANDEAKPSTTDTTQPAKPGAKTERVAPARDCAKNTPG